MSVVKVLKQEIQLRDVGSVEISTGFGLLVHQAMVIATNGGGTVGHVRHQMTLSSILVEVGVVFEVSVDVTKLAIIHHTFLYLSQ